MNDATLPYDARESQVAPAAIDIPEVPRDTRFKPGNQAAKNRQLRLVKLDTPAKVRRTLWTVISDLRKGEMRADVGNATVNALRLLLKVYEVEEQSAFIEEARVETRNLRERVEILMARTRPSLSAAPNGAPLASPRSP